jgi:hypothetical protein
MHLLTHTSEDWFFFPRYFHCLVCRMQPVLKQATCKLVHLLLALKDGAQSLLSRSSPRLLLWNACRSQISKIEAGHMTIECTPSALGSRLRGRLVSFCWSSCSYCCSVSACRSQYNYVDIECTPFIMWEIVELALGLTLSKFISNSCSPSASSNSCRPSACRSQQDRSRPHGDRVHSL